MRGTKYICGFPKYFHEIWQNLRKTNAFMTGDNSFILETMTVQSKTLQKLNMQGIACYLFLQVGQTNE